MKQNIYLQLTQTNKNNVQQQKVWIVLVGQAVLESNE